MTGDELLPIGRDATLVLVRHGETAAMRERRFQGRADTALSARGRLQAQLVAARLGGRGLPPRLPLPASLPRQVIHSPLVRAADTAAAIAAALRTADTEVSMVGAAALVEIAQGAWEGMRLDEIEIEHGKTLAAWRRSPWSTHAPGGESLAEVDARVRGWVRPMLEALGAAAPDADAGLGRPPVLGYESGDLDVPWVVVVGHDGAFRVLLLALLDLPLTGFWRFPFAPAAISVVEIRGGSARLRLHNAAEHLAPLASDAPAERRPSDAL